MTELVIHLRNALKEELDATNAYDKLLSCCSDESIKSVLEEIKKDEINHQGRLLSLLMKVDPSQLETFNKGLAQKE